MKTARTLLIVALSSLSLTACGAKLPGGLTVPGAPSSPAGAVVEAATGDGAPTAPTASTAAAAAGDAADPNDLPRPVKPELVAYYKKQPYQALAKMLTGRRDDIYETVKADIGRDLLWQSGNPDPAWIKVWKTRDWSYASGNAESLVQAAFNRTWEEACKAEFDQTAAAHAKLSKQFAPELAAVDQLTNHYARMAGYIALAAKFEDAAKAAGLDARKDPFGPSAFRVEIAAHAVAYHQGSRASYTSFPWSDFAIEDAMREHGRLITADAAFERQAYCAEASDHGGLTITPFVTANIAGDNVIWPTVWGEQDAVAAKVKGLVAAAGQRLETRDGLRVAVVDMIGGLSFADQEPKLASLRDLTVDSVAPAGGGVSATLSRTRSDTFSYACKETKRIDRIDDDGRIIYRSNCKSGDKTYALKATVTFAELPPGLTLAKGDVIDFTADVEKDDSKKLKDTASRIDWSRTMTLTGRLLVGVKRAGKPLSF